MKDKPNYWTDTQNMLVESIRVASDLNQKHNLNIPEKAIIEYCHELLETVNLNKGYAK